MQYETNLFAQLYDSGTYDSSTYGGSATTPTTGTTTTTSGGVLTNTGFDLLLVSTIAVTLIFIALVVRFWKRPNKKLSTEL